MGESQKVDELLQKLKSLGDRAKSTRSQLGSPLVDRVLERVGRISEKLPQHNGDSNPRQPQQPQEPKVVCPKCGHSFSEDIAFCSTCGFSFQEQKREQAKAVFEREKIERGSRVGVVF